MLVNGNHGQKFANQLGGIIYEVEQEDNVQELVDVDPSATDDLPAWMRVVPFNLVRLVISLDSC